MTLEVLLKDRYRWQNNTIESIGKQLSHETEYSGIAEQDIVQEEIGDSTLKKTIAAMCEESDEYASRQIAESEKRILDIQKQIRAAETEIAEKENQIPDYERVLTESKEAAEKYRFVSDTNIYFSIKEYKNKFIKYFDHYNGGKMRGSDGKLSGICESQIKNYISDTVQQSGSVYVDMGSCEEIYRSIVDEIPVDAELEQILSPAGWIPMFDKVYRIKCIFMIDDLFNRIEKKLNSIYKIKKAEYLRQNKELKDEYDTNSQLRKDYKRDIGQHRNRIANLTEEIQRELEEQKILEENRKKDRDCLTNYVAVSTREFEKQKDQLLNQLASLPPDEKVSTLLFITLLEKDFNNIIGNEVMC